MVAKICWQVNDGPIETENRDCGLVPIMVRVSVLLLYYVNTLLNGPVVRAV